MSFILDALKKSETDRQRQNGPALFEVRAAPARDKLPIWAVGLGVLLAVNLVIVAWVLLRRPASSDAAAQAAGVQQQAGGQGAYGAAMGGQQGWGAQGQGPGAQQGAAQGGGYGTAGGAGGPGGFGASGSGSYGAPANGGGPGGYGASGNGGGQGSFGTAGNAGGPGGYGASGNGSGGQGGFGTAGNAGGSGGYGASGNGSGGSAGYGAPVNGAAPPGPMAQTAGLTAGQQPGMSPANGQASSGAQQPGDASQGGEKLNPDDYAPAADPAPQPFGNHVTRGTSSGVPLYNDVAATNQLPSLRLDLHVYAANPQERFVMINMHKLHEGDLMNSEGVRVESITPFGAVLSRNGKQFLLPRD